MLLVFGKKGPQSLVRGAVGHLCGLWVMPLVLQCTQCLHLVAKRLTCNPLPSLPHPAYSLVHGDRPFNRSCWGLVPPVVHENDMCVRTWI